jgi:hypothetical protein
MTRSTSRGCPVWSPGERANSHQVLLFSVIVVAMQNDLVGLRVRRARARLRLSDEEGRQHAIEKDADERGARGARPRGGGGLR